MRLNRYLRFPALLFLLWPLHAAVVDRVAIVIDKTIVTESEVLDELRLTQFLNNTPLDLGPSARRAAAERLVDQELIRREMGIGGYPQPSASDADALLLKFRQDRFPSLDGYHAAMLKYGINEDLLKQRLLWQLTAIRFTDLRFRSQQIDSNSQSADRATTDSAATSVDQQLDTWLTQARGNSKIAFKPEAFQ